MQLVHESCTEALGDDVTSTHDDCVLLPRGASGRLDGSRNAVGDEGEVEIEAHGRGRGVGDDEERRRADLRCAVAHLVVPTPGPSMMSKRRRPMTTAPDRSVAVREQPRVDRVVTEHPLVERFAAMAEPVLEIRIGAGDEPVERHRDVGDHLRHASAFRSWSPEETGPGPRTHRPRLSSRRRPS